MAAVDTALMVGLLEAWILLADAVVLTSTAPKSNSAYTALDGAIEDIRKGKAGSIPRNLQNKHYDGEDVSKRGQFTSTPMKPLPLAAAAVSRRTRCWGSGIMNSRQ